MNRKMSSVNGSSVLNTCRFLKCFAKSCALSCLLKFDSTKKVHRAVFKLKATKAVIRGVLSRSYCCYGDMFHQWLIYMTLVREYHPSPVLIPSSWYSCLLGYTEAHKDNRAQKELFPRQKQQQQQQHLLFKHGVF